MTYPWVEFCLVVEQEFYCRKKKDLHIQEVGRKMIMSIEPILMVEFIRLLEIFYRL